MTSVFLGKTLLAFALLHFVLQGQICLLFQVSLDFLLFLYVLVFSPLFIKPPQTTIYLLAFLFLGDDLDHYLLYSVMNLCP